MKKVDLTATALEPTVGHTSKGDQPKWLVGNTWYKADHMGYEALSEVLVSELLAKSNVKDFVAYQPVEIAYQGKVLNGCASQNFRQKDEILVPLERLHRAYRGEGLAKSISTMPGAKERLRYTVDFVEEVTGLTDVGPYLAAMLEVDAFFLNEDRHTNNLAVIRNEETGVFRLCPIFDNGLALLSDLHDYPVDADIYACIAKVQAKPFSSDFDEQVEAAEELYGSHLKFSFIRQDVARLLETFRGSYPDTVLQRVERVVLEQMRKYQVFW